MSHRSIVSLVWKRRHNSSRHSDILFWLQTSCASCTPSDTVRDAEIPFSLGFFTMPYFFAMLRFSYLNNNKVQLSRLIGFSIRKHWTWNIIQSFVNTLYYIILHFILLWKLFVCWRFLDVNAIVNLHWFFERHNISTFFFPLLVYES